MTQSLKKSKNSIADEKVAKRKIAVLLTNVGTPDASTPKAVRRYLNEFLSDPRIVSLPQLLWQPILKGIILPFRSRRSAKLYQKIWGANGSPLLTISEKQTVAIQDNLSKQNTDLTIKTVLGMRYGNPSIAQALQQLKLFQPEEMIILPLFPQYSATTTASSFDAINAVLKQWRYIPLLKLINHYYNDVGYINALAQRIKSHWQQYSKNNHLLFSFHGIPKNYINAGDPYADHCQQTASLVAEKLNLQPTEWSCAFQSRFGKQEWIKPYCVEHLQSLP